MAFCAIPIPVRSRKQNPINVVRCCRSVGNAENNVILSIDIGTTSLKAALVDCRTGLLQSEVLKECYPTTCADTFQATQRKSDWASAMWSSASRALATRRPGSNVRAVSVTGQMQALLASPNSSLALPPLLSENVILYCDNRAVAAADSLSRRLGKQIHPNELLPKLSLLEIDTNMCAPQSPPYSLLLGAADFGVHLLDSNNVLLTDATNLSTTGLSQAPHRSYDSALFENANLSPILGFLPKIQGHLEPCGKISFEAATRLGAPELLDGVSLVHAGGDAATTSFGAGVFSEGRYCYVGTSGWICELNEADKSAQRPGVFRLAHPDSTSKVFDIASLATAGFVLEHSAKAFLGDISFEEMEQLARCSTVGARGVKFVPYFGERRCPKPTSRTTGALLGLNRSTTRADIARAVYEGVAFAFRDCAEQLEGGGGGGSGGSLTVCGGGSRSEVLLETIANVMETKTVGGPGTEVGLIGAAASAMVAVGEGDVVAGAWWKCREKRSVSHVFDPSPQDSKALYQCWQSWKLAVDAVEKVW